MIQASGEATQSTEKFAQMAQDRRWRMVNRTIRLNGNQPDALIETLHAVQDSFGFLDLEAMEYVAHQLRVPLSRVYAVATFYHYFALKPPGEHTCVVCLGTACYIGGSSAILESIHEHAGIHPGETTEDGKVSLLIARCLGSCGLAPAAVFDGEVAGKLNPAAVVEKIRRWTSHDSDA
ncbi:MAG: bidirectional hydrogenase complex protein HoxE [Desulforhabdus sp.]|jgi:bidirectional [NiFe] hydrogenase diaphorase subunit|nr:bidirectional hydrogenase complex protein HoxE [Desulforhabdus sp.]